MNENIFHVATCNEWKDRNIIMVNKFKLVVVHFAQPNLMQTCTCAWIYRWTKNCGKSGLGRRAIAGRWAMVGHWAFGPPGRGGPWRAVAGHRPLDHGPAFSKTLSAELCNFFLCVINCDINLSGLIQWLYKTLSFKHLFHDVVLL